MWQKIAAFFLIPLAKELIYDGLRALNEWFKSQVRKHEYRREQKRLKAASKFVKDKTVQAQTPEEIDSAASDTFNNF